MKSWDYIPGVPIAGHVTSGGHWHAGDRRTCAKCKEKAESHRRNGRPVRPGLGKDHKGEEEK